MKNKFYIGCVADDFTGAGDVASFFVKAGLVTVLYNGIPDDSQYKIYFSYSHPPLIVFC